MKNGRLYSVEELLAPFEPDQLASGPKESPPTHRLLAPVPESKVKYWWHDAKEYFQEDD